jgi:hypothetical protein
VPNPSFVSFSKAFLSSAHDVQIGKAAAKILDNLATAIRLIVIDYKNVQFMGGNPFLLGKNSRQQNAQILGFVIGGEHNTCNGLHLRSRDPP